MCIFINLFIHKYLTCMLTRKEKKKRFLCFSEFFFSSPAFDYDFLVSSWLNLFSFEKKIAENLGFFWKSKEFDLI
jgi:hypothetical protein